MSWGRVGGAKAGETDGVEAVASEDAVKPKSVDEMAKILVARLEGPFDQLHGVMDVRGATDAGCKTVEIGRVAMCRRDWGNGVLPQAGLGL